MLASVPALTSCARLAALAVVLAFAPSCGGVPAGAVMHPTADNLPEPGGPLITSDTVLAGAADPERAAEWAALRRTLLDAEVVASIGSASGSGPDLLGVVDGAALDEAGNVYIQDNTTDELLVFSPSGELLARTGGTGDGPTEFRDITRFARLPDGRLVVAHGGGATKVMRPGLDGFEYEFAGPLLTDRASAPPAVIDMCAVGDRIFAHSTSLSPEEGIILEIPAAEGRIAHAFAEGYRADHERDRQRRSYGSIACGGGPVTHAWGMYYFPFVRGYGPDGTPAWSAVIEDFAQPVIYQNEPATPTVHPTGDRQEYIVGLRAVEPGFLIVRTLLRGRPDSDPTASPRTVLRSRTYLVDRETGGGGLVGDDLPWVAWAGDSHFITVRSDPYPIVEVRARGGAQPSRRQRDRGADGARGRRPPAS